jgi:hypothetical protein
MTAPAAVRGGFSKGSGVHSFAIGRSRFKTDFIIPKSMVDRENYFADEILKQCYPDVGDPQRVYQYKLRNFYRMARRVAQLESWMKNGAPLVVGGFRIVIHDRDGKPHDLGIVSLNKVSTSFTELLVDAMQNSTTDPIDVYNFHNFGTDNTAEANTQNDLIIEVTDITAQDWVETVRPAGTQGEGASANIYSSANAGPLTVNVGPIAVEEVAVFVTNAYGAVGIIDRGVTGTVTLNAAETITDSYEYTSIPEA